MIVRKNISVYPGGNDVWGYTAPNGTELAIYGHREGTSFVDATDPSNAVEIFNLPGPTSVWRDIKTYLHYAYIVTEGAGAGTGLQIVDLTDPVNPIHVSTYTGSNFTTAHNIWIDTDTGVAYACGAAPGGGMHILSLADPENPVLLDFFGSYYIHDLYVKDGRAYAGAISSGTLRIIDVSDPSNPITIATHAYPNAATHNAWPNAAATHCATSDENGGGHLKVWDITNLSNINLASEYRIPNNTAIIHNCLIKNDVAYISHYTAGTRVVDLTNPNNPVEIGYYDTSNDSGGGFNGNWGVYPFRNDNVIYSSDRQEGLFILEFTGGLAGEILGVVRDAATAAPLDSGRVEVGEVITLHTDGAGGYQGFLSGGDYDVVTKRFGYESDTSAVTIPPGGTLVHNVDLNALPSGAIQLRLVEVESLDPIVSAVVEVLDTPIVGLISDAAVEVTIPALPVGLPWTVRIGKFGRALTDVVVTATEGITTEVDVSIAPGFSDDFEADQGWTVGAPDDDATDGIWERAIPVGSYWLGVVGPEEDASPTGEGYAYITERHIPGSFVGLSDVDNGKTTLLTPVFDGTGFGDVLLSYQRWFSNRAPTPGNDEFRSDVSTDGGSTWTNLETIDVGTDSSWASVSVDLNSFVTSEMQIRFVAEDLSPDHYVEAGIDDVEIITSATAVQPLAAVRASLSLAPPSPNPFRESTTISFELPNAGPVSVEVFDVRGRKVATPFRGERVAAGSHRVGWAGRDAQGRHVSPGVYFAKLTTTEGYLSRKMIVLR
jgi:choice-of-anchor B domain-containing protein